MKRFTTMLTLLLLTGIARSQEAEDVPQFRGASGLGATGEKGLPTRWNEKENIRWKAALPGRGLSAPVITGGRVFVTAASGWDQGRLHVLCFDQATGKKLWDRQFWATGHTQCNGKTNMAAPTPVTDGKNVYALFATCDLACLDLEGNLVWFRSLGGDYPVGNNVGFAASPVLSGNTLIANLESPLESLTVGLDKNTGENRWKIERPRGLNWVTPSVLQRNGNAEVLLASSDGLTACDVATGKRIWNLPDVKVGRQASPIIPEGHTILAPGEKFLAIRIPDKAGGANPEVLWQAAKLPSNFASPVFHRGKVYSLTSRGILNVADATSGKALGDLRVEGTFSASPLLALADNRIYLVSEEGNTTVVETDPTLRIVGVNTLKDLFMATPVASGGAIFLRSDQHLYCVGERK